MTREELEGKIKEIVVSSLDLEDLTAADIETDVPLFGEGLGLDSIDALELAMAIKKKYGISTKTDDEKNHAIFRSVQSLSSFIDDELARK
jgi:Acyl carrier protein